MLWLLALYSILITASSSYPQSPSSNDGQTVYVSNPAGPFEMGGDSLSVSAGTPLDDINKLNPSFIPPLDYMKTNLGNLPDTTYQQTQIDAPPEITSSQTIPFAQISFDKNSKPPAAFNQALMDEDSPSVPLLDLFRSFPSNIDIPYSGESSGEQKPTDPNPVETGGEEEAKQPRYDPEERVGNPGPPECGQGRYAMCCNRAPVYNSLRQVPQWRGDCRLFGTNWEGCHWRQNVFCCACKDRSLRAHSCFSPIYELDPYYTPYGSTKQPPPPPKYFARPTVGENAPQQGGQSPPQPLVTMGPPRIRKEPSASPMDLRGRPRQDSTCTPEQLKYYRNGGTGLYSGS